MKTILILCVLIMASCARKKCLERDGRDGVIQLLLDATELDTSIMVIVGSGINLSGAGNIITISETIDTAVLNGLTEIPLFNDSIDVSFQNFDIFDQTGCTETACKEYKDSTGTYRIKYEYNGCQGFIPTTNPPGEPHHEAMITVYKKGKQIGDPIQGTYVEKGCFEDVPAYWVKKALGK